MAELNEQTVKHLSQLCRIAVEDKDIPLLLSHLKQVLEYAEQLQEVDVSHISPYGHLEPQEMGSLREDVVENILPRDQFLKNAPDTIGGMIRVPQIIQK